MQTVPHWPFDDIMVPSLDASGGPLDNNASFVPDVGPPITRPRTTALVEEWELPFLLKTDTHLDRFDEWFRVDLAFGSRSFVWRHPHTHQVTRWKFARATYNRQFFGNQKSRVSFGALLLPGVPFCAPYVPPMSTRAPDWIADYTAGKFWNGQTQVTASALSAAISGDYDVLEQRADGQLWRFATYAADLPTSAPSGVTWLAGFAA